MARMQHSLLRAVKVSAACREGYAAKPTVVR